MPAAKTNVTVVILSPSRYLLHVCGAWQGPFLVNAPRQIQVYIAQTQMHPCLVGNLGRPIQTVQAGRGKPHN